MTPTTELTPADDLRQRVSAFLQANGISVTLASTRTGVGMFKLRRWLRGETVVVSYNDALKLERFIGEGEE